jgi:hypothetical protein
MSNSKVNLTHDEHVLHHHASAVKKHLEAYHSCELRDEAVWISEFREFMVSLYLAINFFYQAKLYSEEIAELLCHSR